MSAGALQSESNESGVIRIARYSVYPRAASEHSVHTAFTRDGTGSELHLVTGSPAALGELLRVQVQDLGDGEPSETLARVVACRRMAEGRFELTVDALAPLAPRFVRARG